MPPFRRKGLQARNEHLIVLVRRAVSEDPRWTSAVETTPAASLDAGKEQANRWVYAPSEG
jgi:hypothetical protein